MESKAVPCQDVLIQMEIPNAKQPACGYLDSFPCDLRGVDGSSLLFAGSVRFRRKGNCTPMWSELLSMFAATAIGLVAFALWDDYSALATVRNSS
jgi:hypothetical protein